MTICEWNPKPKLEEGEGGRQQQHENSEFRIDIFQPRTTTQDSTHPIKESEKGRSRKQQFVWDTRFENGSTQVSHVVACNGTHLCDKP